MKGLFTFLNIFVFTLAAYSAGLSDLQFGEIDWGEPMVSGTDNRLWQGE